MGTQRGEDTLPCTHREGDHAASLVCLRMAATVDTHWKGPVIQGFVTHCVQGATAYDVLGHTVFPALSRKLIAWPNMNSVLLGR